MKRWSFPMLALIAAFALACQQQPEADTTGAMEETPVVDAASVEQSIRTSSDQFEQAMVAGDGTTLAGFYTDDAIILPANGPRTEGRDAINTFWQEGMSQGAPTAFTLDTQSVVVSESGDMAYEIGTFTWTAAGPDGQSVSDTGKYVAIWKPTATGEWKIAVDTWNSDLAPAAPTAPAGS